jgi:2-desacetyl-2-hydroxyethyl bacteriochlorophyllide A dehydrogenase
LKAIVLEASDRLELRDIEPPVPQADQCLVRVTHTGICGTDSKIYTGAIPVKHPLIMGHEMAGELAGGRRRVVADPCLFCGSCLLCRSGRTNLCPNGGLLGRDAPGSFAEFVAVPRSHVFDLPEAIGSREAPLIQVLTTCLHAQKLAGDITGQSVAVLGLGVTGQLHVQLARARGATRVIGISRSAWKRRIAEESGADPAAAAGEAGVRAVRDATGGRGADVVIESTGFASSIADAVSMARPGGTLLLFGITTSSGSLPFYQLYFKELRILNSRAATQADWPAAIALASSGAVRLGALVTRVMGLDEAESALRLLASGTGQELKIILENN